MITTPDEIRNWFSQESLNALLAPVGRAEELALSVLAKGGHRWRPLLFAGVSRVFNGETVYEKQIAVAIECMHKASMIHDDIEDDDKPDALHRMVGVPQALNAGDLLIHESYWLLLSTGLPWHEIVQMLSISNRCQRMMCFGQGQELAFGGDFALQKTSPLFEIAFRLGCIGSKFSADKHISDFCRDLGVAYQAKDDLEDGKPGASLSLNIGYSVTASQQFDNPALVDFLGGYLSLVFAETRCPSLPTSPERSSVQTR